MLSPHLFHNRWAVQTLHAPYTPRHLAYGCGQCRSSAVCPEHTADIVVKVVAASPYSATVTPHIFPILNIFILVLSPSIALPHHSWNLCRTLAQYMNYARSIFHYVQEFCRNVFTFTGLGLCTGIPQDLSQDSDYVQSQDSDYVQEFCRNVTGLALCTRLVQECINIHRTRTMYRNSAGMSQDLDYVQDLCMNVLTFTGLGLCTGILHECIYIHRIRTM